MGGQFINQASLCRAEPGEMDVTPRPASSVDISVDLLGLSMEPSDIRPMYDSGTTTYPRLALTLGA